MEALTKGQLRNDTKVGDILFFMETEGKITSIYYDKHTRNVTVTVKMSTKRILSQKIGFLDIMSDLTQWSRTTF